MESRGPSLGLQSGRGVLAQIPLGTGDLLKLRALRGNPEAPEGGIGTEMARLEPAVPAFSLSPAFLLAVNH